MKRHLSIVALLLACGGGTKEGTVEDIGIYQPDRLVGQDVAYEAVADVGKEASLEVTFDVQTPDLAIEDVSGVEETSLMDIGSDEQTITPEPLQEVVYPEVKPDVTELVEGGCDPCGVGDVSGMTCAPNGKMAIPYVKVWVDTIDCMGQPIHIQTYSDAKGYYTLKNVPCGTQTIYMQKGSFFHQWQRYIEQNMVTVLSSGEGCFPSTAAKIMVVTGDWDAIENTLKKLYLKYDTVDGKTPGGPNSGGTISPDAVNFFTNSTKLNSYDVVFIDCSNTGKENMDSYGSEISKNLKAFVAKGGSIYASDYALPYLTGTWPGYILGGAWSASGWSKYPGEVVDKDLAAYLGKTVVDIEYGLGPLTCVTGIGPETHLFINSQKPISGCSGTQMMMSFQPEGETGGRVIYTTFHNDEQPKTQTDMQTILEYTVFLM